MLEDVRTPDLALHILGTIRRNFSARMMHRILHPKDSRDSSLLQNISNRTRDKMLRECSTAGAGREAAASGQR